MKRVIWGVLFIAIILKGETPLEPLMLNKGRKVATALCDIKKLPKAQVNDSLESISKAIKASGACVGLNSSRVKALSYFLKFKNNSKRESTLSKKIAVPNGAKCPVCGMFVSKYPKWASEMIIGDKIYYFDGVKDMMKFYIFDGDFHYERNKIKKILVTDYYTLEAIPAKMAYYVIGSKVYGPMGNELIPFKSEKEAKNFIKDHEGDKILHFNQITPKIVMGLDGIEYNEK